ncbi:hypothetical protein [Kitasatospora aureofaciens]|uniref:hypothetical protein n=1 Tax=Kitasatospora aureofaciens TaxID=1894 RepID=UPI001C4511F0|nr:hypothetical protein [Kitasatospora aureofaciens]MBV6698463.1 hypothetical protein [Kitasatospora aureofaciens]
MRLVRTLIVPLALAAPIALAPAAQAADNCAKNNVCLYSAKDARGTVVWQVPLSQIEKADITNLNPSVHAESVRTPLPAGGDCAVGLFPGHGLGGDAKWANGRVTNLTGPDSNEPVTVASTYVDCG